MPLEYSALQGSTQVVELLFKSEKIGPISQIIYLNGENGEGQSLLQRIIACRPEPETLDLLLTICDFDITHVDHHGQTALYSAVTYGNGFELLFGTGRFDQALGGKIGTGLILSIWRRTWGLGGQFATLSCAEVP